jgi:hypothetical protein
MWTDDVEASSKRQVRRQTGRRALGGAFDRPEVWLAGASGGSDEVDEEGGERASVWEEAIARYVRR